MTILEFIYYLGIASCGIQGSKKLYQQFSFFFCLPAVFLSSHGGGLIRDLFILRVYPAAFAYKCLPDILVALCSGVLYRRLYLKHTFKNALDLFADITDALGLGTFIAMGVDKALNLGACQSIAVISGTATALCGGITCSILCGQPIRKVLTTNTAYRIVAIMGAFLYTHSRAKGINPILAQYNLVLYTLCFVSLASNCYFRAVVTKLLSSMLQPAMVIVTLTPALASTAQYQSNIYNIYISQHLYSQPARVPQRYLSNTNLHIWRTANSLTLKQRCPRRFSRGR